MWNISDFSFCDICLLTILDLSLRTLYRTRDDMESIHNGKNTKDDEETRYERIQYLEFRANIFGPETESEENRKCPERKCSQNESTHYRIGALECEDLHTLRKSAGQKERQCPYDHGVSRIFDRENPFTDRCWKRETDTPHNTESLEAEREDDDSDEYIQNAREPETRMKCRTDHTEYKASDCECEYSPNMELELCLPDIFFRIDARRISYDDTSRHGETGRDGCHESDQKRDREWECIKRRDKSSRIKLEKSPEYNRCRNQKEKSGEREAWRILFLISSERISCVSDRCFYLFSFTFISEGHAEFTGFEWECIDRSIDLCIFDAFTDQEFARWTVHTSDEKTSGFHMSEEGR